MKIIKVTAEGQSIAAGGDVNFNIILNGSDRYEDVFAAAVDNFRIKGIESALYTQKGRSIEENISSVFMIANSSAFSHSDSYTQYFAENRLLETTLKSAIDALHNYDYLAAHAGFRKVLELDPADKIKSQLIYDYFVSGYVGYSLKSNVDAIRAIIADVRSRYHNHLGLSIQLSIAEAHQEVATRQAEPDMLSENEQILNDMEGLYGTSDLRLLNLQGLLFRRFGERKSSGSSRQNYLERALAVYDRIAMLAGEAGMSIEAVNNRAIALVRHFELTQDEASLAKAETMLAAINYDAQLLPLADYLALPKALNNLGNIYKQRLAFTRDLPYYGPALEAYGRTERFWSETGSPYEWAMIQKNKADVRCVYMEVAGFHPSIADQARQEIDLALRYRTESSAPYQYQRTLEVKTRLDNLLAGAR